MYSTLKTLYINNIQFYWKNMEFNSIFFHIFVIWLFVRHMQRYYD